MISKNKEFDIAIIGAGAAGLFCAGLLSKSGLRVALLEHNKRPGRKILISGGGRCNFTNLHLKHSDYVSSDPKFCRYALKNYPSAEFIKLIEKYDVKYYEKKLGQLFCKDSAKDVLNMLLTECSNNGCQIFYGAKDLKVEKGANKYVIKSPLMSLSANNLIIATGGLSVPPLGATDFGHKAAKRFGHKIIPATPALVPFTTNGGFPELSGISVVAEVKIKKFKIVEDVLFTHKGLSGPAILKASLHWIPNTPVKINWLPEKRIDDIFLAKQKSSKSSIVNILRDHFPKRFAIHLLKGLFIDPDRPINEISKKQLLKLSESVHNWSVTPTGTEGFRKAEVTKGGVDTSQINPKTMESHLSPGLFFIGEVLDVTGQLGGFNFQWAWASAKAAAEHLSNIKN